MEPPEARFTRRHSRFVCLPTMDCLLSRRSSKDLRTACGSKVAYGLIRPKFDALHRFAADGMPQRPARSRGVYATVETPVLREKDEERGLSGWLRIGTADPVVQRVSGYLGGGLVYTGLLRMRRADQAGIAISHAIVDAASELDPMVCRKAAETDIELSYRYIAHDWLAIQPDAQIIIHPGGNASVHAALVIGARATINLTRNLLRHVKEASR